MPSFKPLINGINYSWVDITVVVFGVPLTQITSIEYKRKREKKNNYGAGPEPVSRGKGNYEYEGSVTLYMDVIQQILATSPGFSILEIPPFSIIVEFSGDGVPLSTHTLDNVEWTEDPLEGKQGDTSLLCKLPFVFAGLNKAA